MKYLPIISFVLAAFIFSCEGPVGPQGPQGQDGARGSQGPEGEPGTEGFTFEFENVDLVAPDYQLYLPFPNDFQMLPSEVALVYLLWGTEVVGDETLEIWRPIPQTLITEDGLVQYNFDFTKYDISFFMDFSFDPVDLDPILTDDWVVRVVVVPAQFADTGRIAGVDLSDYNAVKKHFNLKDIPVSEKNKSIQRPAFQ